LDRRAIDVRTAPEGGRRSAARSYSPRLSDGAMPAGRTSGSKLMSRQLPAPSASVPVTVSVPASIDSRSAGQGIVASLVGSPGRPIVKIRCHCAGPLADARDEDVEQVILAFGVEQLRRHWVHRHHRPPHGGRDPRRIDEACTRRGCCRPIRTTLSRANEARVRSAGRL
jgi:hypothetical protein